MGTGPVGLGGFKTIVAGKSPVVVRKNIRVAHLMDRTGQIVRSVLEGDGS